MQTRDGIRLDADLYRPDAEGSFPVLLMRQPYGRSIASTVVYAHPRWYAAHGYIVVIQDVRGRGTSAGSFDLFANEVEDGFDTVEWAASLPGSTGQVGMYGFSYQGMTQIYAASQRPKGLTTICPAMLPYDVYTDMAYPGGAFRLQLNLGWAIQLETENARLRGDQAAYQALFNASRHLPFHDPIPARPHVIQQWAPHSYYQTWLDHPDPDPYWDRLSPKTYVRDLDLPMLHIGGWFDAYMQGTFSLYQAIQAQSSQPQYLIVGPWCHLPWSRKVGELDLGPQAVSPIDQLQLRWFDQFLKGIDTGILNEDPIHLFELGSNRWRSFPEWPQPQPKAYVLISSGLAAISDQDGSLQLAATPDPGFPDILVHDPWRPVPSLGGHEAGPAGIFERSGIDGRSDVLTYTSDPLEQDLHVAGEVAVEIQVEADGKSFDLAVVLSRVQSDGKVYNLTQGYARIESHIDQLDQHGSERLTRIPLQPICVQFKPGESIRLSVSGSSFPAYPINPGTGATAGEAQGIDHQIITITVQTGGAQASRLWLPILEK